MDKIKNLLIEANISESAATQITEAMESYKTQLRESYEKDYNAKLQRAQKICESEVESYKLSLDRRMQIFCEAKAAEMERILAKQATERDTEALSKLTSIAGLLEGIEPNGENVSELQAKLKKLIRENKTYAEERSKAIKKANKVMQLAESAQKRNRQLERMLAEGKRELSDKNGKTIAEGTARTAVPVKRLDTGRNTTKSVTTRRTITENQTKKTVNNSGFSIADIASQIEG